RLRQRESGGPARDGPRARGGGGGPAAVAGSYNVGYLAPAWRTVMRSFASLSEKEVLALAISLEEEDARIYDDFAEGLKDSHPAPGGPFRREGRGGGGAPPRAAGPFREEFGRPHPADPPPRRQGLRPPQADLAEPAPRPRRLPEARLGDGAGDPA